MPHIYEQIFETFRVVGSDDSSIVDRFADQAQWLDSPGCLFQRNNVVLSSQIRTEGVIKAGLFISVVLKGTGSGRPREGASRVRYSDDSIAIMALLEPTLWDGDAPRGAHMQAAGIAFPVSSLERLGLRDEFLKLFGPQNPNVFVATLRASPRVKAIAMEMISPVAEGRAAELLLSAHATEILARAMLALQGNEKVGLVSDQKRLRLQAVGDLIKSDLRHPWTLRNWRGMPGWAGASSTRSFTGCTASAHQITCGKAGLPPPAKPCCIRDYRSPRRHIPSATPIQRIFPRRSAGISDMCRAVAIATNYPNVSEG